MKVKFTYRQIYGLSKMENIPKYILEKCELVGKGPSFSRCMQEMLFIILVACFMSMLGWPSLAKISEVDLRLAASTIGIITL